MRKFNFITIGDFVKEYNKETKDFREKHDPSLGPLTVARFRSFEEGGLFKVPRTLKGWRTFPPKVKNAIKKLIWKNYMGETDYPIDLNNEE